MKTTIELPDTLFKRATSAAAQRGISFSELVSEALADKLALGVEQRPWMKSFGRLRALRNESTQIDRLIREEFERIESEDQV